MTKYKNLATDCENMKMRIEEEAERKNDTLRALSKAQAEIQLWKSKFETEALGRIDELEGNKSKLGARVNESEETIDSLNAKIAATEKTKHRIEVELEDLQMEYENFLVPCYSSASFSGMSALTPQQSSLRRGERTLTR